MRGTKKSLHRRRGRCYREVERRRAEGEVEEKGTSVFIFSPSRDTLARSPANVEKKCINFPVARTRCP